MIASRNFIGSTANFWQPAPLLKHLGTNHHDHFGPEGFYKEPLFRAGRALRARRLGPRSKESDVNLTHTTIAVAFSRRPSDGGLSALFLPNRGGHAPLKPEQLPCPQMPRMGSSPTHFFFFFFFF